MPNYSARDMLLRMAEGGPVTYGKGATAADLLAAEQRILGEIAASPDTWDVATAYNPCLCRLWICSGSLRGAGPAAFLHSGTGLRHRAYGRRRNRRGRAA